jgi:hypothetical protein
MNVLDIATLKFANFRIFDLKCKNYTFNTS